MDHEWKMIIILVIYALVLYLRYFEWSSESGG